MPNPSRSASTRFLNPCASFARGNGVFFGISLPRNLHSGTHPSSIFHSSSRSGGTRLRIMATCLAWMFFPSATPARRSRYEGDLKRLGHRTRWCICHIHHKSALNQLMGNVNLVPTIWQIETHMTYHSSHFSRSSFTPTMLDMTDAFHASRLLLIFKTTFALGYAAMSSGAKQFAAASVTATEWPKRASKSAAEIGCGGLLKYLRRASSTQEFMRCGVSLTMSQPYGALVS